MKFLSKVKLTVVAVSTIAMLGSFASCSKKGAVKPEPFMKIGGKTYTLNEFKTFTNMQYNHYDLVRKGFFPGDRYAPTLFIETELLYKEAKKYSSQVMSGKEWEWKKEFLLGQFYQRNIVRPNLGATEEQLRKHFKANKGKILYESNAGDTSYEANIKKIMEHRFVTAFPPTEEFKKGFKGISDEEVNRYWIETQQKRRVDFFRDTYYAEYFKKPYPSDINVFYGEGKEITPADLQIVAKWLPEGTQENLKNPKSLAEIVNFMMTWKLFARKAKENGVARSEDFLGQMGYFEKYELVRHYVNTVLTDKLSVDRSAINSEIAQFALWDTKGRTGESGSDSTLMGTILDDAVKLKSDAQMLKYITEKRLKKKVTFLHADYKDELAETSDRILFNADSLNNLGNKEMAKKYYRDLIRYYPFTKEGVEAYRAIAMVETDEASYSSAIQNYRKYLLLSEPNDEWCKVFFMIAYGYGEYLSNIDLAASNYRWVLKNRPDCDFADDAEFMYLHLGEPISDVEELQAENARQGRPLK